MNMAGAFVLDKAAILDRLGGDEEIYTMMVDMYLQDIDHNCATLAAAATSGDAYSLQREVHTIKGLLATFSDDEGAAVAYQVEQKIKLGNLQGMESDIPGLDARLREVAGVLASHR